MNLEGDHTRASDCGIGFDVIHGLHSVEPKLNVATISADTILLPIVFWSSSLGLFDDFEVRGGKHSIPAAFIVEVAFDVLADISLITADLVVLGNALRPKLNACVDILVALDLEFDTQIEIGELTRCGKELVPRRAFRKRTSDDGACFDPPRAVCIAIPVREGLSVEEGNGSLSHQKWVVKKREQTEKTNP